MPGPRPVRNHGLFIPKPSSGVIVVQARSELSTADLSIEATYPARHCLVSLGRLQRAQAVGSHQDHLVIAPPASFVNPGDPSPPGAITLVPFPGEQVPGHAARQLDQRWRPCVLSHAMSPVCETKFDTCASPWQISAYLLAASRRRDRLLTGIFRSRQHANQDRLGE